MKRVIEEKNAPSHLETYLGEEILFKCQNYFYHGTLTEVNSESVRIEPAYIIYETGAYTDKEYSDKQKLPGSWCIMKNSIESFGFLKSA